MLGTIINTACIIVGSAIGSCLRKGVRQKYQDALFTALGVTTILLGANAFVHNMPKSTFPVLCIVSIAIGSIIGTRLDLAGRFARMVDGNKPSNGKAPLSQGLMTGILLYCIGTFSMLGPVFSALSASQGWNFNEPGNTYLYTNATLDFVSSMVLASTFGFGMMWAAPVLFCWQGLFYLIAYLSADTITPDLMTELSIIGGILITASGFNILGIKDCKVVNMLPSFLIPVLYYLVR